MSDIIREVRDIEASDREALEHVLGMRLQEHQRIVISVLNVDAHTPREEEGAASPPPGSVTGLPPWCSVYEGMTDAEIADVEASIVRTPGSRSFD